jgi:shikimate kinase
MAAPENIFLIGPMGAGKSTIGRQLASILKKTFLDSDHEVERRTGTTIPIIFDVEGETGFRQRESAAIDELTSCHGIVLATGGGVVLDPENRRRLHERGFVVYLHADIETLVNRTRRDRNRPLLNNVDRREKLLELIAQRDPLYRETAHLVVETDDRPPKTVARDICRQINAETE